MNLKTCDTKVLYDVEFEAEIAAVKKTHQYGEEFKPYRCGKHWHITHRFKAQRKGVGSSYYKCPECQLIMKKSKRRRHEQWHTKTDI